MSKCLLGFDFGGTKCAAILGHAEAEEMRIVERVAFPAPHAGPEAALTEFDFMGRQLLANCGSQLEAIGICCGGPLDSKGGLVLGPPNLPGWDNVAVTEHFSSVFEVPARLQNDANACAVAE